MSEFSCQKCGLVTTLNAALVKEKGSWECELCGKSHTTGGSK